MNKKYGQRSLRAENFGLKQTILPDVFGLKIVKGNQNITKVKGNI